WYVVDPQFVTRNDDDWIVARVRASRDHPANRGRDAIYVVERVSEPCTFAILQCDRNGAGQFLENTSQPFSRGRLTVKTVNVGRQNYQDRRDRAQRLDALDDVAAADLLYEFMEEPKCE